MYDSFDKGWFVLQTYSGYENKVKENLLQRAHTYNMLENILRVEIPTQTVQVEKNGEVKEVEENRFPGYVLVEMVMTDEAWFVVRNTPMLQVSWVHTVTVQNQLHFWKKKFVKSWCLWDKPFKNLILMSKLATLFVSSTVPSQTTQVKLQKSTTTRLKWLSLCLVMIPLLKLI